jgi:type I restriction enzyme R subunit
LEERRQFDDWKHLKDKTLPKLPRNLKKGKWVEIDRVIELEELSKKKNLYILVDEAHRIHGFLASFMRTVFYLMPKLIGLYWNTNI